MSCLILTSSWAFAMIDESEQLSIYHKQPVPTVELREYIYKGLKLAAEGLKSDGLEAKISEFDSFVKDLENTIFTIEKKSIKNLQNKKDAFEPLLNHYIMSVSCFEISFNYNLKQDAIITLPNSSDEVTMATKDHLMNYPKHEPYFRAFQNLSRQFLSIRESCLGVPLVSDFETLEHTKNIKMKTFLFKDKDEYVPVALNANAPFINIPVLYGSQLLPRKQFTFHKGTLIEDSGIILSPFDGFLKFYTQYGKAANHPFTSDRMTANFPYEHDCTVMDVLKAQFGIEELKNKTHFITLPTTQEEHDILELLFLEDLIESIEENNKIEGSSAQKFLEWIELEAIEDQSSPIATRIEELKEQILNPHEVPSLDNISNEINLGNNTNNTQKQKNKKTQNKQNKNQKTKMQKKNQSSSNKSLENETKKRAAELLLTVKKEGRVKFKEILGILNKIRSTSLDNEVFNKFATIGRKGSHINFHLEDGEGLTLVRKHGKNDLTYPAKQVNYFSKRLINAMFSTVN